MLKSRDTLVEGKMKQIPKNAVICNSKLPAIISVGHMNDFNSVCEDRQTVRFQQAQSDQLVCLSVDAEDRVDRPIERSDFLFDAAAKPRATFQSHSQVHLMNPVIYNLGPKGKFTSQWQDISCPTARTHASFFFLTVVSFVFSFEFILVSLV